MYNILLCISYDGTNFHGYQRQNHERTVQKELECAIFAMLHSRVITYSSGRTDAGVHADRQYVNFNLVHCRIPPQRISFALNTHLPKDIRVYWSKEISSDFHARYSAVKRSYYYQIYEGAVVPPCLRKYCMGIKSGINWKLVKNDITQFLGTHDFSSFSLYNPQIKNCIRTVFQVEIVQEGKSYKRIYIEANGFLWKMVRTIIGTCLERAVRRLYSSEYKELSIAEIIKRTDRSIVGTVAPSRGLFLYDVQYRQEYDIKSRNISNK